MNVRLLRKVKKHILAEPKRFRMSTWILKSAPGTMVGGSYSPGFRNTWGELERYELPRCGTVGCIAGWTCLLAGEDTELASVRAGGKTLLGLDEWQAERLFNLDGWPENFARKFRSLKTNKAQVGVTAERIEHFIATKGAE